MPAAEGSSSPRKPRERALGGSRTSSTRRLSSRAPSPLGDEAKAMVHTFAAGRAASRVTAADAASDPAAKTKTMKDLSSDSALSVYWPGKSLTAAELARQRAEFQAKFELLFGGKNNRTAGWDGFQEDARGHEGPGAGVLASWDNPLLVVRWSEDDQRALRSAKHHAARRLDSARGATVALTAPPTAGSPPTGDALPHLARLASLAAGGPPGLSRQSSVMAPTPALPRSVSFVGPPPPPSPHAPPATGVMHFESTDTTRGTLPYVATARRTPLILPGGVAPLGTPSPPPAAPLPSPLVIESHTTTATGDAPHAGDVPHADTVPTEPPPPPPPLLSPVAPTATTTAGAVGGAVAPPIVPRLPLRPSPPPGPRPTVRGRPHSVHSVHSVHTVHSVPVVHTAPPDESVFAGGRGYTTPRVDWTFAASGADALAAIDDARRVATGDGVTPTATAVGGHLRGGGGGTLTPAVPLPQTTGAPLKSSGKLGGGGGGAPLSPPRPPTARGGPIPSRPSPRPPVALHLEGRAPWKGRVDLRPYLEERAAAIAVLQDRSHRAAQGGRQVVEAAATTSPTDRVGESGEGETTPVCVVDTAALRSFLYRKGPTATTPRTPRTPRVVASPAPVEPVSDRDRTRPQAYVRV